MDDESGLPFVFEFAFGARQDTNPRRVLVGINAAPTLADPFRTLTGYGIGLDGLLNQRYVGEHQPVTCVAHLTCPHLHFTDPRKSHWRRCEDRGGHSFGSDGRHQAVG